MRNIARNHFRPELLPQPQSFYERELGRLSRPSRGWASCPCPFHESNGKRKRSTAFAVNLATGAFNCLSCGTKGDLVKFVMLRNGVDFKAAAQLLGAWDQAPSFETLRRAREREQQREAALLRMAADHAHLIALRDNLLAARQQCREIETKLSENPGGDDLWYRLALLHSITRELDMQYCAFAGLEF